MDQQTIYMEMYKECCAEGRHHETQRSTITTVSFAFSGAVAAYIAANGPKRELLWLYIFLFIFGLVTALLTYKQYERFRLTMDLAEAYRNAIDALLGPATALPLTPPGILPGRLGAAFAPIALPALNSHLAVLGRAARNLHEIDYPFTSKIRLNKLWLVLFLLIALLGGWFTVYVLICK